MNLQYRLESIAESEFRFNYDFDYSNLLPEKVKINLGYDIRTLMDKDHVVIKATVSLIYEGENVELARNTIAMCFGLSPINDVIILNDDGTFSARNSLILDTFLFVTIGALRGTLMKNLKGTPLESYYLPLIPMEHLKGVKGAMVQ